MNALLWNCHPRKLILTSTIEVKTCFMDRLMCMKNSSHSTFHRSKPWHSQLKEVKAYIIDQKDQLVELRNGELAIGNLSQ